jgi:hypothetical protein
MQALEETRRRVLIEQRDSARLAALDKQCLELRSHVLTLREGELDSRLRDRDRSIEDLSPATARTFREPMQRTSHTRASISAA